MGVSLSSGIVAFLGRAHQRYPPEVSHKPSSNRQHHRRRLPLGMGPDGDPG